ncbi:serine O-acetyltransferase [Chondrocystis sp. NIES-4102]|nr:serine O-acetyltransferase [Chondrocystis sp. NIES-4102]
MNLSPLPTNPQEDNVVQTTSIFQLLKSDLLTTKKLSNQNLLELLFCSPGLQALFLHRGANWLEGLKIPLLPRFISALKRFMTGIEIHPGAKIGKGVLICHGSGVVIGETAIIGDGSLIYQDVTLGGTGKEAGKRHPTLGKNVIVEPGAKVLGNIKIGDNVRICAGAVVLRNVPDNSVVAGVPGRIIYSDWNLNSQSEQELKIDRQAQIIQNLFKRIKLLENQVENWKSKSNCLSDACIVDVQANLHSESDDLIEEFLEGAGI